MVITLSKTIQVRHFEPLAVTVSDEMDVTSKEDYEKLYKRVSLTLHRMIEQEYEYFDSLSLKEDKEDLAPKKKAIPRLKKVEVVNNPYKDEEE